MNAPASSVREEDLGPRLERCPLCDAPEQTTASVSLQPHPQVELLVCTRCGGASASRLPSSEFLSALYEPGHYESSLVSDDRLSARCAASVVDAISVDSSMPLSILDYGGSDGTLSNSLRTELLRQGHSGDVSSTVVDLFPREDTAHQRFITPAEFEKSSHQYDVVLASAVLEHLTNPHAVIRSIVDHVGAGSYFYARTPWDEPLHKSVPGYTIRWPRHLHDLGPAYWDQFFQLFGVEGETLVSRPSIVESSLRQSIPRTVAAHLLKLPGHLETQLRRTLGAEGHRMWKLVGGWEVVLRIDAPRS